MIDYFLSRRSGNLLIIHVLTLLQAKKIDIECKTNGKGKIIKIRLVCYNNILKQGKIWMTTYIMLQEVDDNQHKSITTDHYFY